MGLALWRLPCGTRGKWSFTCHFYFRGRIHVFTDVMLDTQCDMCVIWTLFVVHWVSDVLIYGSGMWMQRHAFNSEKCAPKNRTCLWLPTLCAYGIQCYMPFCNTQAPHMCLYGIHCHVVWVPSFWCPGRCQLWQQHINNDAHVDIRRDMHPVAFFVVVASTKRHTNSVDEWWIHFLHLCPPDMMDNSSWVLTHFSS